MSYLILPSRWTRQPQGPASIDWSNPLTRGLRNLWHFHPANRWQNCLISGNTYSTIAAGWTIDAPTGFTAGNYLTHFALSNTLSAPWTVVLVQRKPISLSGGAWSIGDQWTNVYDHNSTPYALITSQSADFSGIITPTLGPVLQENGFFVSAWTQSGANDLRGVVSGGPLASDTSCSAISGAVATLYLGGTSGLGTTNDRPQFKLIGVYNRAFTDAELREISVAPWQIFRPLTRRIYVPSAGTAGSETVTPGAGALTIIGHAPSAITPIIVLPGAASLTVTGAAPSVVIPVQVQPGAGALTITGHAPTVVVTQAVQPGAGALTITGLAPTLIAPQLAQPGVGALTITGHAPNAVVTAAGTVLPGLGELTITGHAPTLVSPLAVAPGYADLSITGFAPTLIPSIDLTVTPGVADLIIVGHAPAVEIRAPGQQGAGKAKAKRARTRILRDEQLTAEDRRRLGVPEPQETAPEAEQAPALKRAKRTGKASRGIQLAPEADIEAQRAAEILAARTAELMAQQQAMRADQFENNLAMVKAAAAIEADNELMMLLLMAA